jgi:hypothetical protein
MFVMSLWNTNLYDTFHNNDLQAVAEQLACKGEVAAKALRATESAQQTIEKRSKQASALVTEAAHLEEETKVQEAHIFALVAAAERLNGKCPPIAFHSLP